MTVPLPATPGLRRPNRVWRTAAFPLRQSLSWSGAVRPGVRV